MATGQSPPEAPLATGLHMQKVKVRGHSVHKLEWKQTDRRRQLHYVVC